MTKTKKNNRKQCCIEGCIRLVHLKHPTNIYCPRCHFEKNGEKAVRSCNRVDIWHLDHMIYDPYINYSTANSHQRKYITHWIDLQTKALSLGLWPPKNGN